MSSNNTVSTNSFLTSRTITQNRGASRSNHILSLLTTPPTLSVPNKDNSNLLNPVIRTRNIRPFSGNENEYFAANKILRDTLKQKMNDITSQE